MVFYINFIIMDSITSFRNRYKHVCHIDFSQSSVCGYSSLSPLSADELRALSPVLVDGSYHSDSSSLDFQPSLLSRISRLPKNFTPRNLSDSDILATASPRYIHDIADIDLYSKSLINDIPVSSSEDSIDDSSSVDAVNPTASDSSNSNS